jgi:hypothetical protein
MSACRDNSDSPYQQDIFRSLFKQGKNIQQKKNSITRGNFQSMKEEKKENSLREDWVPVLRSLDVQIAQPRMDSAAFSTYYRNVTS